jgi:hypothetical protein
MNTTFPPPGPSPAGIASNRRPRSAGFTVAEVMVAAFVMLFGITSAIMVIQSGYNALDTARSTTLAAQIMQSEMERLRLLPWSTSSLDASGNPKPSISALPPTDEVNLATLFPAGATTDLLANRFTIVRTIDDVPDRNGEIKNITVTVTWTGINGTPHTRTSSTQYAKNGLYDYYYTKADRRS